MHACISKVHIIDERKEGRKKEKSLYGTAIS